jgi:PAS domain S-box-containing protein
MAHGRRLNLQWLFTGFMGLALAAATAILTGHFPDCYREGAGLTRFKVAGEYLLVAAMGFAMLRIRRIRPTLDPVAGRLVQASILCTILAELAFTAYVGVYDFANMAGHLFKVAGYYLSYRALFVTAIQDPFNTLLRELRRSQEALSRAQDATIARMVRLYDALSQVNQAIVKSQDRTTLLDRVCRVLVEHGKFRMAWIGWEDPEARAVTVAARAGDPTRFLDRFPGPGEAGADGRFEPGEAAADGRSGPGQALRTGAPCIISDFNEGPADLAEAAREAGFTSMAALPIRRQDRVAGVLCVYAARRDFFGLEEMQLLEEAASDLSFALDHLEMEQRRRLDEESLRASEEKFSKVFHSAPLMITLARLDDGRLVDMNETFCRVTGFRWEEMVGRSTVELGLFTAEGRAGLVREVKRQGRVRNLEVDMRARDGRQVPTLLAAEVIDVGDEPMLMVMSHDLTEIRQSEQERRLLQAEVEHMQKMESLGRLAGGIAHDMNNVLGAILAVTQTLGQDRRNPEDSRRDLETIEKAAMRGRDLVKGLSGFSRKGLDAKQPIDPNELARQEMALLDRTLMKKYELRLDLEEPLDPVLGERSLLGSALMNLCVNAADAMPAGGTLTLRTRKLPGSFVLIEVEDTGEGMDPVVQQRAMEPFFTTKPLGKGTGLGLSIAFNTAASHGGSLTLDSKPGRGTRARLRLPAMRPALSAAPAPGSGPAPASAAAMNLLLVDDDELLRGAVANLIRQLGHRVEEVDGGPAALAALERPPVPDLVILDLNMPGMNGLEVLDRIRAKHPELPVLLATGSLDETVERALATDPHAGGLAKPFTLEQIRARLAEAAQARTGV